MKTRHEIDEAPILLPKPRKIVAAVVLAAVVVVGTVGVASASAHGTDRKMLHDGW